MPGGVTTPEAGPCILDEAAPTAGPRPRLARREPGGALFGIPGARPRLKVASSFAGVVGNSLETAGFVSTYEAPCAVCEGALASVDEDLSIPKSGLEVVDVADVT
jgi:hypothetical protein